MGVVRLADSILYFYYLTEILQYTVRRLEELLRRVVYRLSDSIFLPIWTNLKLSVLLNLD